MDNFAFVLSVCSVIIFVAFFIRSLTGFGGALISVPLLALFFDLKFIVPLEALLEVVLSLLLLNSVYSSINKRALGPLVAGAILGSIIGSTMLASIADIWLKRVLGLLIILFALNYIWGKTTVRAAATRSGWGLLAGAIGGIFGGLFGTSGPPYVMYLSYRLPKKTELRATLIGLFTFDYGWRTGIFATTGLLTLETLWLALYLTPALLLGTYLGHRVHLTINETLFRQVISLVLLSSGLLLLLQ